MAETNAGLTGLLRTIAAGLRIPVIIVLILLLAAALIMLGSLIAEVFTEQRFVMVSLPALMEEIRKGDRPVKEVIAGSKLMKRHKKALTELTAHPDFSDHMREALGNRLVDEEQNRLELRTKLSDMVAKLGPMFGLLGTLIPLGPGIVALGQGDTLTLSQSLLTAFDTTIVGMIAAAIALVISAVRKTWYKNDLSALIALTECVLEKENENVH